MAKQKGSKPVIDGANEDVLRVADLVLVENPSPPDPIQVRDLPIVEIAFVGSSGSVPVRGSDEAAGYDLRAAESLILKPMSMGVIGTGIVVKIPIGFHGEVRSRSGLAAKQMVFVLNSPGTIDSDYRGEVKVILMNLGTQDFWVNVGDRIAQLVISPHASVDFVMVDELDETERGVGGLGSTGVV